ncbi:hypothetical protein HX045_02185 [Myroides odoratimimus]|uniref:DUF6934 family protein n=1 Tax=Myroides odoratimimus TaxID=76832 RepID=UPI0004692D58|nr:hypothetical protein [Myroides odoratimimus]MCA4805161.1 hypothetical protein [Myroides odoratimimus]MDM1036731.1 hypothetical protein [Myroides odoratimimus]MDM1050632.1 hypothetical protein [Myroides odoratimimus]MDM1442046.1 hypothetical protein [Myroides odoratimimus]MDM1449480.1 hypothetical protein [Myroides odoratimimus]
MQHPSYSFTTDRENSIYEFTSIGKNQAIKKLIIFAIIKSEANLYNLSFGDKPKKTLNNSIIDDRIVSNNGDMNRVLATVFRAVLDFTKDKGFYKIVFRGSTPSRTRLYRMVLSTNYEELSKYFNIYGVHSNGTVVFFAKNTNYQGYLITPNTNSIK